MPTVLVRPFPRAALPRIWSWLQEFRRQMADDYSPRSLDELAAKYDRDEANGQLSYAIVDDNGTPIGSVWAEALGDGIYAGHLAYDRYMLSTQQKLAATRAAIARMHHDGARKIYWQAMADNRAFIRFLRQLGAQHEGTFREATRRNGALVDVAIFATLLGRDE